MNKVKLVLVDYDGVFTSHKTYDKTGLCISKSVTDQTWTAIKRFRAAGVPVHVLTGDPWNEGILAARNIPAHFTRGVEKTDFLPELCQKYNVAPEEICYIGDDLFDVNLLRTVGFPYAPRDAAEECFDIGGAELLFSCGGSNVIMELFYKLRAKEVIPWLLFDEEYAKIKALDKTERF